MNRHLERVKAEDERNRSRARKSNRGSLVMIAILLASMMYFVDGGRSPLLQSDAKAPIPTSEADDAPQTAQEPVAVWEPPMDNSESVDAQGGAVDKSAWNLILVSAQAPLPQDFTVDLVAVPGGKVDARIADALDRMTRDAAAQGVSLLVCSAYRNVKEQSVLYEKKLNYYRALGYNEAERARLAGRFVQPPGSSEHHTGLAIDFWTGSGGELTDAYARTDAYFWLSENAARYGFIERYPADKEEITGIAWEPWHFRYVGTAHAAAIKDSGLCLEEYLAPT